MRMPPLSLKLSQHRKAPARSPGWANDEQGATAVEFGLVALPFFLFVLGLIGIGC
jgi:Flp pilus assembly protein TadG